MLMVLIILEDPARICRCFQIMF